MSKYGSPEWEEAERQMKADIYRRGKAEGLREAIEVIDTSEGDMDFAKFKLESRIQEIDPQ